MEQDAGGRWGRPGRGVSVTATIGDGHGPRMKGRRSPSSQDRIKEGKKARLDVPLAAHAEWDPPPSRTDPIDLLEEQAATRIQDSCPSATGGCWLALLLLPGRRPLMTEDLAGTPRSGFEVQLCGDAHMSNFGVFGSPERHLIFDVNDFDETAPGPWEWDVKRLAASLEIAGRENAVHRGRGAPGSCRGRSGPTARPCASWPRHDESVWYAHLDVEETCPAQCAVEPASGRRRVWNAITKARAHDSHPGVRQAGHVGGGETRIIHDPPLIVPVEEFVERIDPTPPPRRWPGSSRLPPDPGAGPPAPARAVRVRPPGPQGGRGGQRGHRCLDRLLLVGRGRHAPLFLQIKEAQPSVLERFTRRRVLQPRRAGRHRASASCRRPATSSSVGSVHVGWTARRVTTTSDSSGTGRDRSKSTG